MFKKFVFNCRTFACLVTLFALLALTPCQSKAMDMRYGDWEIDGFLRNNTGVWTESWKYTHSNDPLATCRNWFRLNLNGDISNSLKLKAEVLAIYEPEYEREKGGGIPANTYNSFDFREMRLDWRPVPGTNIRIGKQIVNWGESLSARVGDIINPVDGRFDLGFTNLEDTRMPVWMIRGLHQISAIGTSLDWIFAPYMGPDRYRVSRTLSWAPGLIDASGSWDGTAQMRWTPAPETRIILNGIGNVNSLLGPAPVLWPALNQVIYGPIFTTGVPGAMNGVFTDYPDSSLEDSRIGFKTSSNIYGAQTGVYFLRTHMDQGIDRTPPMRWDPVAKTFTIDWEQKNIYGFYANKNFDFGVLRMDVAYRPNVPFQTMQQTEHPDLVTEIDELKVQVGYNKDFMIRALNPDQTFGLIVEYVGNYLLTGDTDGALFSFPWYIKMPRDDHQVMVSFGTNYNFGMWAPNLTVIYDFLNNGLVQPSIAYTPDWMNRKWSFKLQYTNVFAENNLEYIYGLFHDKDNVVLTTQFSFP